MLNELRKQIVIAAHKAKEGHVPSALSILDILHVLHEEVLGPDDKFVLSKGHGSLALYAVLGLAFSDFCQYESKLGGHPDRTKVPGIAVSSGSLGHGIGQAVGIALAKQIAPEGSGRVFCLVGDGECEEGSVWEAFNLAERYKLANLTVIVDLNGSNDSYNGISNLRDKLIAFGFIVIPVDGHNHEDIRYALKYIRADQPIAVIAKTAKARELRGWKPNLQFGITKRHRCEIGRELLAEIIWIFDDFTGCVKAAELKLVLSVRNGAGLPPWFTSRGYWSPRIS